MASHRRRPAGRIVLRGAVAATLAAALVSAGALSFAQASSTESTVRSTQPAAAVPTGLTVADLLPTPTAPDLEIPDVPLPDQEPEPSTSGADHCGDVAWWNARQQGDPSDYVAACGTWPSWIDRGDDTTCLPGERDCADTTDGGAAPYTGPTVGRPWSPEHGYYEGRTDGPKNSQGEPCMQGRDNHDPNC